ncbi:neutral zinc metallopeptidase [Kribbella sp. NPDC048915]|uniref:neutral zinc metallopeptidase n=1 Tax=Kribbella sp. NPDC048915 TaxID=3155148 RepID=UPI0033ED2241
MVLLIVVAALVAVVAIASRQRSPLPEDTESGASAEAISKTTEDAERSLLEFWRDEQPRIYDREFTEPAGGFQPKTPQSGPFTCGGERLTYDDVRGNAFYCGAREDFIAWDAAELFPRLTERFGQIAPAIVLAHEMGHAVQARVGVDAPSVIRELQADCFAGAWTRFAENDTNDPVSVTDASLDTAVATILTLRDQPGTGADAERAHGLGFDRVNAYQTGYEQGAERCARFPDGEAVVTELPFRTVSEARSGGNLPYDETVEVLSESLNDYWAEAAPQLRPGATFDPPTLDPVGGAELPECPGQPQQDDFSQYCASSNSVEWLTDWVQRAHAQIGDVATGAVLSDAWAEAGQRAAGLPTTGKEAGLQRDCLTGAWLAYLAQGDLPSSQLSPGDLDEALTEIVLSSLSDSGHRSDRGGAFERSTAFRTGIFEGTAACRQ